MLEDDYSISDYDYEGYKEYRERRIIEYSKQLSINDIDELVKNANSIIEDIDDSNNKYSINQGLELIVQNMNEDYLNRFLDCYIEHGNSLSIRPYTVLEMLNKIGTTKIVLNKLKMQRFPQKNEWLFVYFETVPKEIIDQNVLEEFLEFLRSDKDKNIKSSCYRRLRLLDKFLEIENNIYPIACSIIYEKRAYSEFIVDIYFELLFHTQVYSPTEVLELFAEDRELLQNIYFYSVSKGHLKDYKGDFFKEFIKADELWIRKYSEIFWNIQDENNDYRIIVLWESDDYLKHFDYLFNCIPKEGIYSWHVSNKFKMLFSSSDDETVNEHKKAWLVHLIKENAHSTSILIIFDMICELHNELRYIGIDAFLKNNDDYEVFEKLSILPNHWSGTDSFIPAYQNQIDFLLSLYPLVTGMKFINHRRRITEMVEHLKERIKKEEVEVVFRHLYM